jgi:gliding motility-associated-like protein
MKNILIIALTAAGTWLSAQNLSIPLSVINSAGSHRQAASGFWLTDNVGESFVSTLTGNGLMLTQGFLQADEDVVVIEVGGVTVFNLVTPNNDGKNDKWIIEGLQEFPDHTVLLFNRWGQKIFESKNYDKEGNSWPSADQVNKLTSSTYFYIIDLGKNAKPIRGWVEVIKN